MCTDINTCGEGYIGRATFSISHVDYITLCGEIYNKCIFLALLYMHCGDNWQYEMALMITSIVSS